MLPSGSQHLATEHPRRSAHRPRAVCGHQGRSSASHQPRPVGGAAAPAGRPGDRPHKSGGSPGAGLGLGCTAGNARGGSQVGRRPTAVHSGRAAARRAARAKAIRRPQRDRVVPGRSPGGGRDGARRAGKPGIGDARPRQLPELSPTAPGAGERCRRGDGLAAHPPRQGPRLSDRGSTRMSQFSPPRPPQIFSPDDPLLSEEPVPTELAPNRPASASEAPPAEAGMAHPTLADLGAHSWRWGVLFVSAVAGATALTAIAWVMRLLDAALARDDWLGWSTLTLLLVAAAAALMLILR